MPQQKQPSKEIRNPNHEPVIPEEYPVQTRSTIPVSKRWPVPDKDARIFLWQGQTHRFCGHCRLPKPIAYFGRDSGNAADGLYEACDECRHGRALYGKFVAAGMVTPQPDQTWNPAFPTIVCLCGSTRFWRTFQEQSLEETMAGRIVLSIGAAVASDEETFKDWPPAAREHIKASLDELHLRKIDLADQVLVLNVGGYIGPSTAAEIRYALKTGKEVRYLEAGAAPPPP